MRKQRTAVAILMGLAMTSGARADTTSPCFDGLNGKTPAQIHQLLGMPVATSIDTVRGIDWVDEVYKQRPTGVLIVGYIVQGDALKVGKACRGP